MSVYGNYPAVRMRRMRRDDFSRRMRREHVLTANDLIWPVFIIEGKNTEQPVPSMPGVVRYTVDRLLSAAEAALELRIPTIALFPAIEPALKTPDGREATNPAGLIPRAIAAEIAEPSLEQERLEAFIATRIQAGEPLWGNYPPSEETDRRFREWRDEMRSAGRSIR